MSTNQSNFRVHAFATQNALQPSAPRFPVCECPEILSGVTVLYLGTGAPAGWAVPPTPPSGVFPTPPGGYIWITKVVE